MKPIETTLDERFEQVLQLVTEQSKVITLLNKRVTDAEEQAASQTRLLGDLKDIVQTKMAELNDSITAKYVIQTSHLTDTFKEVMTAIDQNSTAARTEQ